jgi:hypothetical protein
LPSATTRRPLPSNPISSQVPGENSPAVASDSFATTSNGYDGLSFRFSPSCFSPWQLWMRAYASYATSALCPTCSLKLATMLPRRLRADPSKPSVDQSAFIAKAERAPYPRRWRQGHAWLRRPGRER